MILRGVITLIGLVVLVVCVIGLPHLIASEIRGDFDYGVMFIVMYISAVPFFVALYQALKLLGYIDKNETFTASSVSTLRLIKRCAYSISLLYTVWMPYVFYLADQDDAPGVVAIGLVIVFASFVIATFAGVMQKLVQSGVDLKSENDLAV